MPSKFDQLREGKAVEFKPGLVGKLNPETKDLEFSDGFKVNVAEDKDFYPMGEQGLSHSREKEKIRKQISGSPLGEFGFQLGERGLFKAAKNWANKLDLTQTGEDYLRNRKASEEISQEISEESPYTSMAATAASFVPDILLTKGLGAGRAAAGLAAAHAGPRIVEEPLEVAKESAIAGAGGYLIGKGADWLGKVAKRRGEARQIAQGSPEIAARNEAGMAATNALNQEEKASYNLLKEKVGRENEARLHQHKLELNSYKKRAIDFRNAFEKAKFDREAELFRLKQEKEAATAARSAEQGRLNREYEDAVQTWKIEKKALQEQASLNERQYQEALKDLPRLQKEAQVSYGKKVVRAAKDLEKAFHEEGTITPHQLQVRQFVDAQISKGPLAASPSASSAQRIIKAIFPEGETIGARELAKRYESLEGAIARSNPEVADILTQFKEHIGERLPYALADNIAYKNVFPSFRTQVEKAVSKSLQSLKIPEVAGVSSDVLSKLAHQRLQLLFKQIGPEDFVQKMRSGEISNLLKNGLLKEDDFTKALLKNSNLSKLKRQGVDQYLKESTQYELMQNAYRQFAQQTEASINNLIARNELKILSSQDKALKKLGGKVEKTFGKAEELEPPIKPPAPGIPEAPLRPSPLPEVGNPTLPPPISPPPVEAAPVSPVLESLPSSPAPRNFTPEPVPTLPEAQNLTEKAGDLLEKKLLGGNTVTNNPLLKLGALKYFLGKGAVPAEAAYGALKGLTSPSAGGQVAREAVRRGGIEGIAQLAERYPSYHDGIVENPEERRSLTKEIEDDPSMSLEEKALLQSKVNRGRSLFERL